MKSSSGLSLSPPASESDMIPNMTVPLSPAAAACAAGAGACGTLPPSSAPGCCLSSNALPEGSALTDVTAASSSALPSLSASGALLVGSSVARGGSAAAALLLLPPSHLASMLLKPRLRVDAPEFLGLGSSPARLPPAPAPAVVSPPDASALPEGGALGGPAPSLRVAGAPSGSEASSSAVLLGRACAAPSPIAPVPSGGWMLVGGGTSGLAVARSASGSTSLAAAALGAPWTSWAGSSGRASVGTAGAEGWGELVRAPSMARSSLATGTSPLSFSPQASVASEGRGLVDGVSPLEAKVESLLDCVAGVSPIEAMVDSVRAGSGEAATPSRASVVSAGRLISGSLWGCVDGVSPPKALGSPHAPTASAGGLSVRARGTSSAFSGSATQSA
mmetsp:Transcript_48110/g.150574  ORF Transcript_48110/g.150574 Transcript_48110/m.150574 type:complete len:390 (+) Transcript_48110:522-1691(+)